MAVLVLVSAFVAVLPCEPLSVWAPEEPLVAVAGGAVGVVAALPGPVAVPSADGPLVSAPELFCLSTKGMS